MDNRLNKFNAAEPEPNKQTAISAPSYSAGEVAVSKPSPDENSRELRRRVDYLLITLSSFLSCFVFFGAIAMLASKSNPEAFGNSSNPLSATQFTLIFALAFGYMVSSIIGGIILAARFLSSKTRTVKILAAVFFLVTYMCVGVVGIYGNIPYQIYNFVRIIKLKKNKRHRLISKKLYRSLFCVISTNFNCFIFS